jgi:hypothetical protein
VDPRIRTLVENGVKLRQRSLFVIVGDKGRDQVRLLRPVLAAGRTMHPQAWGHTGLQRACAAGPSGSLKALQLLEVGLAKRELQAV